MFIVYGDESSDGTKERVFAVAGIIGREEQWKDTAKKWAERTSGKVFHASDCETEYANDPDPDKHKQNLQLYADLTQILVNSNLRGFGVALDLSGYREFFPDVPKGVEYYKCFTEVLKHFVEMERQASHKEMVEFIFDQRRETEHNTGKLYGYMVNQPEWNQTDRFLGTKVSFDSRSNVRIQMADLVARETMKHFDSIVGPQRRPIRRSMEALATTNGRFSFDFLTREYCEDWKRKMPQLEERADMHKSGYAKWLLENKLSDNWTNRFEYLIWLDMNG